MEKLFVRKASWTVLVVLIVVVYVVSISIKLYAEQYIPVDHDEPTYLKSSIDLGECVLEGNLSCLTSYEYNIEHPYLVKIIYGLAIKLSNTSDPLETARYTNIYLSSLVAPILTILSPFAGIIYACEPLSIKYGSEVYLDSIASLFTLASIALLWSRVNGRRVYFSALLAGAALASKYTSLFALASIPLYLLLKSFIDVRRGSGEYRVRMLFKKRMLIYTVIWIIATALCFYILNPSVWLDPYKPLTETRLYKSLVYHRGYSEKVLIETHYPPYQQFLWITTSSAREWHSRAFIVDSGLVLLILGYLGLPLTVFRKPLVALWITIYTLFLILWPVKWPQYLLLLTIPLSLSSSILIIEIVRATVKTLVYIDLYLSSMIKSLIIISLIIVSALPITLLHTSRIEYCIDRGIYVSGDYLVIDDGVKTIVFNIKEGMKPIKWIYCSNKYNPVNPVKRGTVYNLPYEWIPANKHPWPGEIYFKEFNVSIKDSTITAYTLLEVDAPNVLFIKKISVLEDDPFSIDITYILANNGSKPVSIASDPSWNVDWGFSIELALTLPHGVNGVYQFYRFVNGTTVIDKTTWTYRQMEGMESFGVIDYVGGMVFEIEVCNTSSVSGLWFEYSSEWIVVRVHFKPVVLELGEHVIYKTKWRLAPLLNP